MKISFNFALYYFSKTILEFKMKYELWTFCIIKAYTVGVSNVDMMMEK